MKPSSRLLWEIKYRKPDEGRYESEYVELSTKAAAVAAANITLDGGDTYSRCTREDGWELWRVHPVEDPREARKWIRQKRKWQREQEEADGVAKN